LMLGDWGWLQRANLVVTGLMTLAAAVGIARATRREGPGTVTPALVAGYAVALLGSAAFAPDPMGGFPPGAGAVPGSLSGVLHLAFGAVGFLCLTAAALTFASWCARRGDGGWARLSRLS